MKTYLSIDIDYFNAELINKPYRRHKSAEKELLSFFKQIQGLSVPVLLTVNHDEILPDVNKFKCEKLVNVDYHSDLADLVERGKKLVDPSGRECPLNEGTWVNFVNTRKSGIFEWRYPTPWAYSRMGRCEEILRKNFFTKEGLKYHNWANTPIAVKGMDTLNLEEVGAIGICLSPGWVDTNILDLFLARILPQLKGCKLNPNVKRLYTAWKEEGEDFSQFDWCEN